MQCDECEKDVQPDPIWVDTAGYGNGPNHVFCSLDCLIKWANWVKGKKEVKKRAEDDFDEKTHS